MYRVYNKNDKCWVENNIFLSPNPYSELYIPRKTIFNGIKLVLVDDENYIIHRDINLHDKDGNLVYEGDYLECQVSEDRTIIGMVTFAPEFSSYIVLCFDNNEYYTLGTEIMNYIKIIGNVFDGVGEEYGGQQSLQEETV